MTNKETLQRNAENLQALCCPRGSLDIWRAVEIADEVGRDEDDIWSLVENRKYSTGVDGLDQIDIVYLVYCGILQEARNTIDNEYGFDIQNDSDIDVYGNYMASSFDYGDDWEKNVEKYKNKYGKVNE